MPVSLFTGEHLSFFDNVRKSINGSSGSDDYWQTQVLPSGIPGMDHAMGGGWGFGRLGELFGNFSSGKSMALLATLASNQKRGGLSILKPTENDFDAGFFEQLGGNPDELLIPDGGNTVEDLFELIKELADEVAEKQKNGDDTRPVCFGWDGIAATASKHLLEEGMEKQDMSIPKAISQGCKLITEKVKRCNMCVIATNQIRDTMDKYGPETDTPGGRAWKFHASQRVELKFDGGQKSSLITVTDKVRGKEVDLEVGRWVVGKVVKNKLASPLAPFWLPIYTLPDYPHPTYPGRRTQIGIDLDEALLEYYVAGRYFVNQEMERVVQGGGSGGWYWLHQTIDIQQTKFHACDWPKKLEQYPQLRTLLYDDLERQRSESA